MKIKTLFSLLSICFAFSFIACDDDLNEVGGSIQPPNDTISVATDTIAIKARTVSMADSVYARTINGVLGKYEDNLFGTIKSDYLCQFYFPEDIQFDKNFKQIDSTLFVIDFTTYSGDPDAPMGLSLYEVTQELPENFYTNIDPTKYANLEKALAKNAYTVNGAANYPGSKLKKITANLGTDFGKKIYDAWKNKTITDDESFNRFFKGMYVTTDFGNGNLIDVQSSSIDIYYKHFYTDSLGVQRDTTGFVSISVTPEVMQVNHIKNKNPDELFEEGTGATYLKTPAGVYTEIVFPIGQITKNMKARNMSTVNSAQFLIKGYTEREPNEDSGEGLSNRPQELLLIDKDSLHTFFKKQQLIDNKTSFLGNRNSSNTYSFLNLSKLVKEYQEKGIDNPTFVIIPVKTERIWINPQAGTSKLIGIYNKMQPSTAILRSDPKNMKFELVYSKF